MRGLGLATPPQPVATALQNASNQTGVPLSLLQSVAYSESSYNPSAVSPAGAQGLMQLMPATAKSLGVTNPLDPNQSALGGAQYLQSLYAQYGDWNTALIAYNEGPGALASKGAYQSSQNYASTILDNAGFSTDTSPGAAQDSGSLDLFSSLDVGAVSGTNWGLLGVVGVGAGLLLYALLG